VSGRSESRYTMLPSRTAIDGVKTIRFRLFDGIYVDPEFINGLALIYDVLADSRDKLIVEQYGLWIIGRDVSMGIKVNESHSNHSFARVSADQISSANKLFTDSKQKLIFDTRDLFTKISQVDEQAGDLFLESTVLQKRDSVSPSRWSISHLGIDWLVSYSDQDARLHADLVKRYINRLTSLLLDVATKEHLLDQGKRVCLLRFGNIAKSRP
jgi:hypothetical protein